MKTIIIDNCFKGTYRGKRVLITGHTGFKGAWLTLFLHELGAEIAGYSLEPPTTPSLFEAIRLEDKITHVIGDIRDEEKLVSVFQNFQPEFVFHLAAQPLVRLSYKKPKFTYETNIMGTVNLFEAVRKTASVKVIVNVTSDKCYDNKEYIYGYREIDPVGGNDPYSSSKGCAELITSAYRHSFFHPDNYEKHGIALSSVRAGNVIGGGDWAEDRLVPDCMKTLFKNETVLLRNPNSVRPWQFVLEPLSGYLWLGALMYQEGKKYGSAWNFGPGDARMLTVENIVKRLIKSLGRGEYSIDLSKHPHEASLLKLDCTKAKTILKWESVYDADTALEKTLTWYKCYYSDKKYGKMYNISLNQIIDYINDAKNKDIAWTIS